MSEDAERFAQNAKKCTVKELHNAYCCHDYGHWGYEHWTHEDTLLIEEVLQEARRILDYCSPGYPNTNQTVLEVIGEDGFTNAQRIAQFRAGLQEPDRAEKMLRVQEAV